MEIECEWFTHLMGRNPNTGLDQDEWGCAISWLPVLLVETTMVTNQASAEISKLRSVVEKPNLFLVEDSNG